MYIMYDFVHHVRLHVLSVRVMPGGFGGLASWRFLVSQ